MATGDPPNPYDASIGWKGIRDKDTGKLIRPDPYAPEGTYLFAPPTPPAPVDPADRWLTVDEACAEVKVSRNTLYGWIKAGKVEVKVTAGGRRRVRAGSLWREEER